MAIYLNNQLQKSEDIQSRAIVEYNTDNTKRFTQPLKMQGAAYEIIKAQIIDDPEGRLKDVNFKITSDCCNSETVFLGAVRGDTVNFRHGACDCEVTAIENSAYTRILNQMKTLTLAQIMANNRDVPNVRFKVLTEANFFGFGGDNGRHPCPFISDIIQTFCDDFGLIFDTSSFMNQSPYDRMALFHMPTVPSNNQKKLMDLANLPIWTLEDLLNNINLTFNTQWYIDPENLTLYLDRKDIIRTPKIVNIDNQTNIELNCQFVEDKAYAAIDIQYALDAYDTLTQDKQVTGFFNGVFSWNTTNNENQDGLKRVSVPFSASSFQGLFFWGSGYNVLGQSGTQTITSGVSSDRVLLEKRITGNPRLIIIREFQNNWYVSLEHQKLTAKNLEADFWSIDNPNNETSYKRFDFDLKFTGDCDFISNFNPRDKLTYDSYLLTIERATINHDTGEVNCSGYLV